MHFPFRLERRWRPLLLLVFGVRRGNAFVDLAGEFDAHFGWYRLHTPLANVVAWRLEGPWRWITAIGVRMSIRHRDLTFGGTSRGGLRIDFAERVPMLFFRVPALYVTVEDQEGLAAALTALGIHGEDVRTA